MTARALWMLAGMMLICFVLLLLSGCAHEQATVRLPDTVYVPIEKHIDLPDWSKPANLPPKPRRVDTSVSAHFKNEDKLDAFADYLLCVFTLLDKVDHGEKVDAKECVK